VSVNSVNVLPGFVLNENGLDCDFHIDLMSAVLLLCQADNYSIYYMFCNVALHPTVS